MRLRSNILNGYSSQAIDKNGGVLTLPLLLVNSTPTLPLEAASKQYVDSLIDNIDASRITGVFQAARLPALNGTDVTSSGGGVLTLSDTGVVAGTYTKVNVDSKGRVTGGSQLTAGDIPVFSFNKLTNRPTTLVGYGITDGISINGGTFTGSLLLNTTPTLGAHAANKEYVDARVASIAGTGDFVYKTGDILAKSTNTAQTGFLRANGSKVSKVTYSALYTAIQNTFDWVRRSGIERPWRHQYQKDFTGALTLTNSDIQVASGGAPKFVFMTKNRAYYAAGTTFFTSDFDGNGTPNQLTTVSVGSLAVIPTVYFLGKNRVWCFYINTSSPSTNAMYSAPINNDGTIGQFQLYSSPQGTINNTTKVVRVGTRFYFFTPTGPGLDHSYANIAANEDIGAFNGLGVISGTAGLNNLIDVFVIENKLYALTCTNSSGTMVYTPYYATINEDSTISSWTAGPTLSLPARSGSFGIWQEHSLVLTTKTAIQFLYQTNDDSYGGRLLGNQLTVNSSGVPVSWSAQSVIDAYNSFYYGKAINEGFISKNAFYIFGSYNAGYQAVRKLSFNGVSTDYSSFYDGTDTGSDPNNFYIPSLASEEKAGLYWYIKH